MKKLCAMLLCITMLLTSFIFAEAATSLNLADTFDDLAVGTITAADIAAYSNAFDNCNYFRPNGAAISITNDGYMGNAVTFVEDGGTGFLIDIRDGKANANFAPTADAPVYLNFKMKIVESIDETQNFQIQTSAGSSLMYIQKSGDTYMWFHGGDTGRFECIEGEWVDVQVKMTAGKTEIKVSDMHGHINTCFRNETSQFIRIKNVNVLQNASIALDEIRIIQGDGTDDLNITASNYGSSLSTKTVVVDDNFDTWDGTLSLRWYMDSRYGNSYWALFPYDDYATITANNCKGDVAPVIETKTAGSLNCKSKSASYETGKVYTSFQLQVVDDLRDSNNGVGKYITQLGGGDGKEYIWIRNGCIETRTPFANKTVTYNRDDWYTIVTTFEKNEDTTNHLTIKVYNEAGNVVLEDEVNTSTAYDAAFYFEGVTVGGKVSFDDVKVIHEESTVSNVINGSIMDEILGGKSKENLSTTTPVIIASFDGIVADGSTAKFVSADKEIAATVKFTGSSLVEIAPVSPLDYDTSYTLDLSGIKGLNEGLATGSTTALSLKTPVYSVGTMAVGTPAYNGTQVTVPVTFTNENVDELNATVIAALFSGENSDKLVWAQTKNVVAGEMGDNEFTFTNLPENADTMDLKIFVWDNFTALNPLYK